MQDGLVAVARRRFRGEDGWESCCVRPSSLVEEVATVPAQGGLRLAKLDAGATGVAQLEQGS